MSDKVYDQIIEIQRSGETNMFDTNMVQVLADKKGFFELVVFLEEHKKEYVDFILSGKRK